MVMKFHNFDIFYKCCYIFDLSSALACRVESIKHALLETTVRPLADVKSKPLKLYQVSNNNFYTCDI